MNKLNYIILLLVFHFSYSQKKFSIVDKDSGLSIPFVNIWLQNKDYGTSADELGKFHLELQELDTLIFSAVGYERLKIRSSDLRDFVQLNQNTEILEEVVVIPKFNTKFKMIDDFNKKDLGYGYSCRFEHPWIVAKFFTYRAEFYKTPFIQKIKIATDGKIHTSKYNFRIYLVGDNDGPGELLAEENLIMAAKSGKMISEIDLSHLHLKFPEKGLFIGFEWLTVEENKSIRSISEGDTGVLRNFEYCEPSLVGSKIMSKENWKYTQGKWEKITHPMDIIPIPAIAIGLSN